MRLSPFGSMPSMPCVERTLWSDRVDYAPKANLTFDAQGDPTNGAGLGDLRRELSPNALARVRHGDVVLRSRSERRSPVAHYAV